MSKRKQNLIVVAHPDDESLFFAGLVLSQPRINWHVACVTDGNADKQKYKRYGQFKTACKKLKIKETYFFEQPDIFEKRLDVTSIQNCLSDLPSYDTVYTHGPLGEYGHPHHQDVSFAVHDFYAGQKVLSPAYNCFADQLIKLSPSVYRRKTEILSKTYFSETYRFINFLHVSSFEAFTSFSLREVIEIYDYFATGQKLRLLNLQKYRWMAPYFSELRKRQSVRVF